MRIKEKLKQYNLVVKIYTAICDFPFKIATMISPKLNTIMRYKAVFGVRPDLRNPKTFSEKLLWLKLNCYMNNPLVIKCADKYAVRDYIKETGCERILNKLIGVYDNPYMIPWDNLPNQFVLKWNFGAGYNLICKDKSLIDYSESARILEKWGKEKYWLSHSEMQYKNIPKKIICEAFLSSGRDKVIPDYKVYCFNGNPKAILVMHDRGGSVKSEFFDENWNKLKNTSKYSEPINSTIKPECLPELLAISKKLSKPFPFVRCDFYIVDNTIYFGELTFTPAGGLYTSETIIEGRKMEDLLDIDNLI